MVDRKTFTSHKDSAHLQDRLGWEDVHFRFLMRAGELRVENYNGFCAVVNVLDSTLEYFKDEGYKKDIALLEHNLQLAENSTTPEDRHALRYDGQFRILCKLLGRVNEGERILKEYAEDSDVIREIGHRLLQGQGQNMFITGTPGSGKSWSALRIAIEVTKLTGGRFSVANHVVYTPLNFSRVYNDEEYTPEGSAIIFDEVGVTFGSRDALTKANKIFAKLCQIIRHRRLLIIFTAPDLSFMDAQARKMLHWWMKTKNINRRGGYVEMEPHVVDVVQRTGDLIFPYPRFDREDKVTELRVRAPPDRVAQDYEKKTKDYKDSVAVNTEKELAELDDSVDDARLNEYLRLRKEGVMQKDIKPQLNITAHMATKYEKVFRRLNIYRGVTRVEASAHKSSTQKSA